FVTHTPSILLYSLSLHDALPISGGLTATPASIAGLSSAAAVATSGAVGRQSAFMLLIRPGAMAGQYFGEYMAQWADEYRERGGRSEEHTSELQSRENLVCRLLLE